MSMSVMVLNKFYQPVARWTVERAVISVYLGKAEVIRAEEGRFLRSVNTVFAVPAVIRLVQAAYNSVIRHRPSRKLVFKRDNYTCLYCGCKDKDKLTLDHIDPTSRGGDNTWENLATACFKCNNKKSNRTPEEMGWKRPKVGPYLYVDYGDIYS